MKLSEAIRLGAMLKPQGFGDLWSDGKSCALGAAYDALGCGADAPLEPLPMMVRVSLEAGPFSCPGCRKRLTFGFLIAHLNDDHRWTRERIADWVATVEPAETPDPQSSTNDAQLGRDAVKKPKAYTVDRLPLRVRAHFPDAKTVSDSTERINIRVQPRDQRKATAHDPSACAMARACQREEQADGAWIGISVAYVLKGTHLTRYLTPQSVAREIVSFDRHADFAPGDYSLASVPPSLTHRMGPRKSTTPRRQDGSKPRGPHKAVSRHRTVGIRKGTR